MTHPRRRIVYAGFATPRHSGGVHVLTEHVRLLRAAGEQAWLWLPRSAPDWIAQTGVPVLEQETLLVGAEDLLVLPETPTVQGRDPAPGARKIIFNQNHFYTFAAVAVGNPVIADFPGWDPAPGVWAVTAESRDVLAAVLPHLSVDLIPDHVDTDLFKPARDDRPRVAWFPRKRPREASLLRRLLELDPRLAGVDLVELVDVPRSTVAAVLSSTTVFVALGHSESFGLPVAEAMAAGCLVAGYDGGGGHQLFEAPGTWRIPEQRPLLLRDQVVDLLDRREGLAGLRDANRTWVTEHYSVGRTTAALTKALKAAFDQPGSAATAVHPAAWLGALGPNFTAYA